MRISHFIHCILVPREYFVVDGVTYLREGFKPPERFDDHLRREHPKIYNDLIESTRKGKKV